MEFNKKTIMRRNIKLLICCLLLVFFTKTAHSQFDTISLSSLKLKGTIKSIKDYTSSAEDRLGIIDNGKLLYDDDEYKFKFEDYSVKSNFNLKYDISGNNIEKSDRNRSSIYFLYKQNKIVEKNETRFYQEGRVNLKYIYLYNNDGNIMKITIYRNEILWEKLIYEYNENGLPIRLFEIDADGKITEKEDWKYNKDKISSKNEYGDYPTKYNYLYDENGKLIEETTTHTFLDNSKFRYTKRYEYQNNKILKEVHFNDSIQTAVKDYIYNGLKLIKTINIFSGKDNSRFIKTVTEYNDGKTSKETIEDKEKTVIKEFDENENVIRLFYQFNNNQTDEYIYQYTFDDKKNWTKIIEFKNTIPTKIRNREIEYFKK